MSKNHSRMGDKTNKDKSPEFKENQRLEEYSSVVIDSPNKGKEQNYNKQTDNQNTSDNNKNTSDTLIIQLKNSDNSDAAFNYKKDFLVLDFNQTEDQNSLEYKRKILAKKLMTDITFSLNKAFEFSFEDKIKNNIMMTLSKYNKTYYDYEEKKHVYDCEVKDNQFILDFCNGDIDMNTFFLPVNENESKIEKTDIGNKNTKEEIENTVIEDEIAYAKKNYVCMKGPNIVLNYEEDEPFDQKTYDFFLNYMENYKNDPLGAKIKLVLSYITEVNPHTKKAIYPNKEKNKILRKWKNEYENAYNEKVKIEMEKKKFENKEKKKIMMARESIAPTNNLSKKKTNKNNVSMSSQNNNNDLRATGNFNYDNNMGRRKRLSILGLKK
jgi:hypothetical protein